MFTRMTWLFHRVIVLQINTITQYYAMQILVLNTMQNQLVFSDDGTGPADESKRTKRGERWSRQIMEGGFYYLQYYCSVK